MSSSSSYICSDETPNKACPLCPNGRRCRAVQTQKCELRRNLSLVSFPCLSSRSSINLFPFPTPTQSLFSFSFSFPLLLSPPPLSLTSLSSIMVSPFFANAFPLYSVVEKVELKAEAVKDKVAGAVGASPTGADLYARFALAGAAGCAVTHGEQFFSLLSLFSFEGGMRNGGREDEWRGRRGNGRVWHEQKDE